MAKYELQGDCLGPTVIGKKGDVLELSEEVAAPLGDTLKPLSAKAAEKKAEKK